MKYESEFGLGEICIYNADDYKRKRSLPDLLVKVVAVTIEMGGAIEYTIESITTENIVQRFRVSGVELTGDPDYDQVVGCYPHET